MTTTLNTTTNTTTNTNTTVNTNTPGELIVVTLKDGPFRHLHGEWLY